MIETELRILEIDKSEFVNKIKGMGAKVVSENLLQKRYVYDIKPNDQSMWMRLRTNGIKTTLTTKHVFDKYSISGTEENEVEVSDFNQMHELLKLLGFKHRNYQENMRSVYQLGGVEISVDSWPLIPDYAELEGVDESEIYNLVKALDVNPNQLTTLDVNSIYKEIYGIDMLSIKNLKMGESYESMLERYK